MTTFPKRLMRIVALVLVLALLLPLVACRKSADPQQDPTAEKSTYTVQVKTAGGKPFRLMTMTREAQMVTNDDEDYATVMVCASTEFATEALLSSAVYGNNDVILAAARGMGKEFVPVDLELKPFASSEISEMSTESKNTYTAVLAIVPAALVLGTGVFVLVRRKYS